MIERLDAHRQEIRKRLINKRGKFLTSRGLVYTYDQIQGFVYIEDDIKGVICYLEEDQIEILSLDVFSSDKTIKAKLLDYVKNYACDKNLERISLLLKEESEDIHFYQEHGFRISKHFSHALTYPSKADQNESSHEIEMVWLKNVIYFGSHTDGLKEIHPGRDTLGNYIYGSLDPIIAAIYLANWNDYIFRVGHDDHRVYIIENFPGALKSIFYQKSGFIYELPLGAFKSQEDLWDGELISLQKVNVLAKHTIDNVYDYIIHRDKENLLDVYLYPNRPDFVPEDDSDLIQLALKGIEKNGRKEIEKFLIYHPRLQDALESSLSNEKN